MVKPGDKIRVYWSGKWITATFVKFKDGVMIIK